MALLSERSPDLNFNDLALVEAEVWTRAVCAFVEGQKVDGAYSSHARELASRAVSCADFVLDKFQERFVKKEET